MKKSITQKVAERFFGEAIQAKVKAGIEEQLKAAAVSVNDNDETGWRKLTGSSVRDLSPVKQRRMYEIAIYLWENTPLGKWIIEILKDFLIAEGLPFESDNDDVSQALEDFWYDPLNQMDVYLEKHVREQWLFGVLCLPAFTAKNSGSLRLGYVDPAQIKEVITDPGNVKMVIGVILEDQQGHEGLKLKTILPPDAEDILTKAAKALRNSYSDGECFYSAVNNLTNNPMGRSELLVSADWIDAYEQFLFDATEKWTLLNSFLWDITVQNGDKDACQREADNLTKKAGSAYAHNQNVTLQAITPDLKSQDVAEGAKTTRNHILGAHGYPSFWFGGGEDANRALGVEMGTPAFKMLSSKQRAFKAFLELILQTVIDRRRAARTLVCTDEDAKNWSVVLPELTSKDITKNSAALQQVTTSLATAIQQEILDTVSARKIFLTLTATLGIEIDEADVEKRLKDEVESRERKDYEREPSPKSGEEGPGSRGQGTGGPGSSPLPSVGEAG